MDKQPVRIPKYRHHKSTNRAVVTLNGRDIYLGVYDSAESHQRYRRLIAEWLGPGQQPPADDENDITVIEISARYLSYAKSYYGEGSTMMCMVRVAIRRMRSLYGEVLAAEFGPIALQALRDTWIRDNLARRTVNGYTGTVTRMFRWAASQELIPATTSQSLATVPGLRAGRSQAKETKPKKPVPDAHVAAIRPYVSRQVWALVQLQLLTAGRSSELIILRSINFDVSGPVWVATLSNHKTAHRGKEKTLYFGPQAQAIVRQFMAGRPVDAYLFSPRDAEAERHAAAPTHRRPGQPTSPPKTRRKLRDRYSRDSYRQAVARACKLAGVPHWHPHRLRHNAATIIRRESDIETARIVLGHASGDMTEVYAERDRGQAIDVMSKIG